MKNLLLFCAFLLFVHSTHSQGLLDGFSKGKGNLDVVLGGSYQTAKTYYAGTTKIDYDRSLIIANVFAVYGVSDKWDVALSIPFVKNSLQDFSIGTKYKILDKSLLNGKLTLFPALQFSTPILKYNTEGSAAVGQRSTLITPKGIIQFDHNTGVFIQVQSGYNYALDPVTSSFVTSGKIGWHGAHLYLDAWYDKQTGYGNKDYLGDVPYASFRELVVSYDKIGATLYYGRKNWGISTTCSYVLSGRNTWKATTVGISVIKKILKETAKTKE